MFCDTEDSGQPQKMTETVLESDWSELHRVSRAESQWGPGQCGPWLGRASGEGVWGVGCGAGHLPAWLDQEGLYVYPCGCHF